jgi:hypothetical protein
VEEQFITLLWFFHWVFVQHPELVASNCVVLATFVDPSAFGRLDQVLHPLGFSMGSCAGGGGKTGTISSSQGSSITTGTLMVSGTCTSIGTWTSMSS